VFVGGGGGSYTGDFERLMKEGCRNWVSLCEGFHEGDLVVGFLYWGTQDMLSKAQKWASASVRAPL